MKTLLVIGCVLLALVFARHLLAGGGISPSEANTSVTSGKALLIDVREPSEWTSGVAAPALLLPMSDLNGARKLWSPVLESAKDKQLVVYCASGARSAMVAAKLRKEGFDAVNLGGFGKWRSAGLPTKTP